MSVGDEERDDPARDRYFGPLISEDEESAEDCRFVFEGLLKKARFGIGAVAGNGAGQRGRRRVVDFVGAEGEVCEDKIYKGNG